ncbi:MAG: hypothetical protein DCC68_12110 [Planctomycetota bacterium]|nr:MAG: hypothetical protein DCC68_12110 [Planctomycetota bacterium]
MRAKAFVLAVVVASLVAFVSATLAQRPDRPRPNQGPRQPNRENQGPAKGELPADEKLMGLYLNFVRDAEKLAKDYEAAGKTEQARGVYLEILKFAPNYKPAKDKLEQFREKEETADKKSVEVHANQGWQETGITTVPGKLLTITATGTWTCKINQEVGPEGLQVSEQLKDCNVGSLVGVVVPPPEKDASGRTKDVVLQPFSVGAEKQFTPSIAGKLMFRIYDIKTADNSGKLKVEVMGTFERK